MQHSTHFMFFTFTDVSIEVSDLCSLTFTICRVFMPSSSSAVIQLALMQWLVYNWNSRASIEIVFMNFPSVLWPTAEFRYQMLSFSVTLSLGRCQKLSLFPLRLDMYFSNDSTGHFASPETNKCRFSHEQCKMVSTFYCNSHSDNII